MYKNKITLLIFVFSLAHSFQSQAYPLFNRAEIEKTLAQRQQELRMLVEQLRAQVAPHKLRDEDLEYIALEILYNIPTREVFRQQVSSVQVFQLSDEILSGNQRRHYAIQISGHTTRIAWRSDMPNRTFIVKPEQMNQATMVSKVLAANTLGVDYVPELPTMIYLNGKDRNSILRERHSALYIRGDKEIPVHAFFSSPYIYQLALQRNMSIEQFLEKDFIPKFADMIFKVWFGLGLITDSHTQNLRLVISPNGSYHFALKDFSMYFFHPVFAENFKHYNISAEEAIEAKNSLSGVNSYYLPANPKGREIGFNFATYAYQTITKGLNFTFQQQAIMLKSFFDILIHKLEKKHGIMISLSAQTNQLYVKLPLANKEEDIPLSLPTLRYPGETHHHLGALSEAVMNEITEQLYKKVYFKEKRTPITDAILPIYLDVLFTPGTQNSSGDVVRLRPATATRWSNKKPADARYETRMRELRNQKAQEDQQFLQDRTAKSVYEMDSVNIYRVDIETGQIFDYIARVAVPDFCNMAMTAK